MVVSVFVSDVMSGLFESRWGACLKAAGGCVLLDQEMSRGTRHERFDRRFDDGVVARK